MGTPPGHSMALESFLQGASLLQLTEALVSKADQVFVLPPLTTKLLTAWCFDDFAISGLSPARIETVVRSFGGGRFSYDGCHATRLTTHQSTCTPSFARRPSSVILIGRTTGTQTLDFVL